MLPTGVCVSPSRICQDDVYDDIGRAVRAVGRGYVDTFNAVQKK